MILDYPLIWATFRKPVNIDFQLDIANFYSFIKNGLAYQNVIETDKIITIPPNGNELLELWNKIEDCSESDDQLIFYYICFWLSEDEYPFQ